VPVASRLRESRSLSLCWLENSAGAAVEQWPLILILLGLVDPAKSGRRRPSAGFMLPPGGRGRRRVANYDSDHRDSARISDVQILKWLRAGHEAPLVLARNVEFNAGF
jgi:hypothetical protein